MKQIIPDNDHLKVIKLYKKHKSLAQVANIYNTCTGVIVNILKKHNVPRREPSSNRKHTINKNYFDKIDTEEKAYILGFLYADGCNKESNCISLKLGIKDIDILQKIKMELKYSGKITYYVPKPSKYNRQKVCCLDITHKYLSKKLYDLGCVYRKTFKLKFPTQKQVPNHLIKHFIRGYFDGDGNINISKPHPISGRKNYGFRIVGIKSFLEAMRLEMLKFVPVNIGIYPHEMIYTLQTCGNLQTMKIFDWMYKDASIYLNRKYQTYLKFRDETRYI